MLIGLEIRCREHEAFSADCAACQFIKRLDAQFEMLRVRRRALIKELRKMLRRGDVIPIEIT
jgi:hypothetical protein